MAIDPDSDGIVILHDGPGSPRRRVANALAAAIDQTESSMACGPVFGPGRPHRVVAAGYELGHDGGAPRRIPLLAGEAVRRRWATAVTPATRPSGHTLGVHVSEMASAVTGTDAAEAAVMDQLRSSGPWTVVWAAAQPGELEDRADRLAAVLARREDGRGERHEAQPPSPETPGTPLLPPAAIWVGARPWKTFPGIDTHEMAPTVAVRHPATDWGVAERWGDHHFASALSDAFARRAIGARVVPRHAWDHPFAARELVITLRGLSPARPVMGRINVLWVISHPEDLKSEELGGFDLIAVASEADHNRVGSMTSVPVIPLLQATDASQHREPGLGDGSVVFVGNTRGTRRRSVEWAIRQGIRLSVYGQGWDDLYGEDLDIFDPIDRSAAADRFNSATVVLGDHWDDMRKLGYVSNRVFDVAAAGGLLLTDRVAGIDQILPGVVTYGSAEDLGGLVRRWLDADPAEREKHIARLQTSVLSRHTFDHRLDALLGAIRTHVAGGSELVDSLAHP